MAFRIPDVLRYAIRHRMESLQNRIARGRLREWVNEHPGLALGGAGLSVALLLGVLVLALRPTSGPSLPKGKTAWFYDVNKGKLFRDRPGQAGPIAAPSGPGPNGEPAGFRAHVYSYTLNPKESGLFVGFLERPDPNAGAKVSAFNRGDFDEWAKGRLIRRVKDKEWVWATSPEGQAILREIMRPNERGQTPIYHVPGTGKDGRE